jgi:hypothetical protein
MRALATALTIALCLWSPAPASANALCRWLGLCLYLSPGFKLTVLDAETGKPLSDVYAWAEWTQYGAHGRGGPLMVQDAHSTADGHLTFPRWGPRAGPRGGLVLGIDPAVILFKPGYTTLLVENGVPIPGDEHAAIRGMSRNGETLRLQPFRGSVEEWVEQLRRLVYPALSGNVSDEQRDRFRATYVRRMEFAIAELEKLPHGLVQTERLRAALERSAVFFRGGKQ